MKSKLVLIFEQSFNDDIKIIANNERDLMSYLSINYQFSEMEIDSDNFLSFRDNLKNKYLVQLQWIEEI